ncbi:hypothetical protein [Nonomuraea sp. NPDC003214]
MRFIPDLGRLGLRDIVADHLDTLYEIDHNGAHKKSKSDYLVFFGIPGTIFLVALLCSWKFKGTEELLAGVSILTALLFGLLVQVFTLGLKATNERVAVLLDEMRSNISYACGVGLLLSTLLMITAAFELGGDAGAPSYISASISALFSHLVLTLLMVIKRVRTAYKIMAP